MVSRVEIVLDFICAESYIGFTRLRAAAERLRREGADVRVGISPHQLRPQAPNTPPSRSSKYTAETVARSSPALSEPTEASAATTDSSSGSTAHCSSTPRMPTASPRSPDGMAWPRR